MCNKHAILLIVTLIASGFLHKGIPTLISWFDSVLKYKQNSSKNKKKLDKCNYFPQIFDNFQKHHMHPSKSSEMFITNVSDAH